MLVLSRKVGEKIVINENITLVIQRVSGHRVSIGIEAPQEVSVQRGELRAAMAECTEGRDDKACEARPDTSMPRRGLGSRSQTLGKTLRPLAR